MIFVYRAQFSEFWKNISGYGAMYTGQYEGAGTWTFTIMLISVLIVSLIFKDQILNYDQQATKYINAIILAVVFLPLTFVNPSAMRVVEYFSIYFTLLLPDLICIFKDKERNIAGMVVIVTLVMLYLKSGQIYYFM